MSAGTLVVMNNPGAVTHIAYASDAVSQEKREMSLPGGDRINGHVQSHIRHRMDVHDPKAGDEVLPFRFHNFRVARHLYPGCWTDGHDLVVLDEDTLVPAERTIRHIDNRSATANEACCALRLGGTNRSADDSPWPESSQSSKRAVVWRRRSTISWVTSGRA